MSLISQKRFDSLLAGFSKLQPVLVVGDIGIDKYTYGNVKRISPEAPVPVLEVGKEWLKLGLAANVSHNLNTIGIDSTLCGIIGEDFNARHFESLMDESGLNHKGLIRAKNRSTIFKERIVTNTQQICRIDYESNGDIEQELEQEVSGRVDGLLSSHSALILEDYAKGIMTEKLVPELIEKFKGQNKLIAVDPGRTTPPLYYKGADLLKPNLDEARIMVEALGFHNEKRLEKIVEILVDKLELKKLVVTLGPEGMALFDREHDEKMRIIPTVATDVFDVSGAGDTAISLLVAGLLAGGTLEEAAWLGNCGSGVVVAKKGTATVSLDELSNHYQDLKNKLLKTQ